MKKQYHDSHYAKNSKYLRAKHREYNFILRFICLNHYSNGTFECSCCGEDLFWFLTIDDISGAIHKKFKGQNFFLWLIKNNFPKGFRVLCWNCNCGRRMNKCLCPHEMLI